MAVCDKGCTTVEDLIVRVSRQLGDYSDADDASRFVAYSRATLLDYYNEAVQQLVANRPDTMAKTVELTLSPGSLQTLPEPYTGLVKIELNVNGAGAEAEQILPADEYFSKVLGSKTCFAKKCVTAQGDYAVRGFTKSAFTDMEFTVSPPVPPGTAPRVKAVVLTGATKVCASETSECVAFNPIYAAAVTEWMLYRAWGSDAEIVGGANAAAIHFRAFFQMIGVQIQREQQFFAGEFRPPMKREAK